MDDHMLDRLLEEIELCFEWVEPESEPGEDASQNYNYKAAAVLIKAYNSLVKLYYSPEYIKYNILGSVKVEYKKYLANK